MQHDYQIGKLRETFVGNRRGYYSRRHQSACQHKRHTRQNHSPQRPRLPSQLARGLRGPQANGHEPQHETRQHLQPPRHPEGYSGIQCGVEIRADPVYLDGMKALDLKSFFAQSLGFSDSWKVTEVAFVGDQSLVRITVQCAAGVVWADLETGERTEIKGWRERTWHHLDTCHFQTIVTARNPRLLLRKGKTMSVSVPWAEPAFRRTRALEEQLIELLQECRTVRAAAGLAVLTDDVVDGVMRRAVKSGVLRREESFPARLGVDAPERSADRLPQTDRRVSAANQKSITKGHRDATLLVDLDNGCVIDVADGEATAVAAGLLRGRSETASSSIEAIAMDMSTPYIAGALEVQPEAAIGFHRLYVAMHLNAAVDKVRRTEHRKLSAIGDRGLRNNKYFRLRSSIAVRTCGAVVEAAGTIMRHIDGILNYLKAPITNASLPLCRTSSITPKDGQSMRHFAPGSGFSRPARNDVLMTFTLRSSSLSKQN